MVTPVAQVVKVNWKLVFPWLALFRSLGLALHVRQIVVGMVAVLLIAIGEWAILGASLPRNAPPPGFDPDLLSWISLPWVDLIYPLVPSWLWSQSVIVFGPGITWWQILLSLLRFVWILVVGGLAGGVLVRRAGMEFAREETVGLLTTVRFVLKRSLDYLSAPALPLAIVGAMGVSLWLVGVLARSIPGGEYVLSAMWGLVLIAGIIMAILTFAVLQSWPLMIAAVSLNGGDGFDALSRGFGMVLDRWRYYAWCLLVMAGYGVVSFVILMTILSYGDYLAKLFVGIQAPGWNNSGLNAVLPIHIWPLMMSLIFRGFAYSYFWSSMAIIYLLLRQSLDNAELHDIYVEGSPQDPDGLQALVNPTQPETPAPTLLPILNQP